VLLTNLSARGRADVVGAAAAPVTHQPAIQCTVYDITLELSCDIETRSSHSYLGVGYTTAEQSSVVVRELSHCREVAATRA
jgi:hypothetical protein